MNKTGLVSIEKLAKNYSEKVIIPDDSQRNATFTPGVIRSVLFYAYDNNSRVKTEDPDLFEEGSLLNGWHGYQDIVLVKRLGGYWLTDGGHRMLTLSEFFDGKACKGFKSGFKRQNQYLARLAKRMGKDINDSFTFDELPADVQKKVKEMTLSVQLHDVKDPGESFLEVNQQKAVANLEATNATYVNKSAFYDYYIEASKCISKYKRQTGVVGVAKPSWYDDACEAEQNAYVQVCENIQSLKHSHKNVFALLLRCTEVANWSSGNCQAIIKEVCENHKNDSKSTALLYLKNTLMNMSIASNMLKDADGSTHLCMPILWTGAVHAFGQYHSRKFRKTTGNPKISNRFMFFYRETFNNMLADCLAGTKTNFKNSNLTINGECGSVFNSKYVCETAHQFSRTEMCASVMTAIYNEIKEAK